MSTIYLYLDGCLVFADKSNLIRKYGYFERYFTRHRDRQSCQTQLTRHESILIEDFTKTHQLPSRRDDIITLLKTADYLDLRQPHSFKLILLTTTYLRQTGIKEIIENPSYLDLVAKMTNPSQVIPDLIDKKKMYFQWQDLYQASLALSKL